MAVWYPTAVEPKPYNYAGPTNGMVATVAVPLVGQGSYRMLAFSHGYGGSGLSAVFFTEQLASRGWIVVAPDHHDKHSAVRIQSGQLVHFDRKGFRRHARKIAVSDPRDRAKYLYRLDDHSL